MFFLLTTNKKLTIVKRRITGLVLCVCVYDFWACPVCVLWTNGVLLLLHGLQLVH